MGSHGPMGSSLRWQEYLVLTGLRRVADWGVPVQSRATPPPFWMTRVRADRSRDLVRRRLLAPLTRFHCCLSAVEGWRVDWENASGANWGMFRDEMLLFDDCSPTVSDDDLGRRSRKTGAEKRLLRVRNSRRPPRLSGVTVIGMVYCLSNLTLSVES